MVLQQYGLDCLDECSYLEKAREAHKAQKLINYSDVCAIPDSALCIIEDYMDKEYNPTLACKSVFLPSPCYVVVTSDSVEISENDVISQFVSYTGNGYSDYTETSLDKVTWSSLSSIDIQTRVVSQVTGPSYNIQSSYAVTQRPNYISGDSIVVTHTLSNLQWQGLRNALDNVKPHEIVKIRFRGNTKTFSMECYGYALRYSVTSSEVSIGCDYDMRNYHLFTDLIAASHNTSLELRQASNVSAWSNIAVDDSFHTFELTKYSLTMPPMYGYIKTTIHKSGCPSIEICKGVTWEQKYSGGDFIYVCDCPEFVPTSYTVISESVNQIEFDLYVANPSGQYTYEEYLSYNPLGFQIQDAPVFDPGAVDHGVFAFSYKLDCNQTNYIYVYVP